MSVIYEVKCGCGNKLEVTKTSLDATDDLCVEVEKCSDCCDEAKEEGRKEGHTEGYDEGIAEASE